MLGGEAASKERGCMVGGEAASKERGGWLALNKQACDEE